MQVSLFRVWIVNFKALHYQWFQEELQFSYEVLGFGVSNLDGQFNQTKNSCSLYFSDILVCSNCNYFWVKRSVFWNSFFFYSRYLIIVSSCQQLEIIVTHFIVIPSVDWFCRFPEHHTIDSREEALSNEENGVLVGLRSFWGLLVMCQEALPIQNSQYIQVSDWIRDL